MKPNVICHPSPNFKLEPNRAISCLVLHATETSSLSSPLSWLCDPKSQVSAHYLIDIDGTIYQLVDDRHTAWHAGKSEWDGIPGVNHFSIGIEMVNLNDGKMPYPEPQVAACADLVKFLVETYKVSLHDIVRHADIAPGRKNDPLGFDMEGFKRRLIV